MLYEKVDFESSENVILKAENIIEYPFHKHDNVFELILVLKGEINLYLVNAHEKMTEGDVQICNPNELHYLKGVSDDNVVLFLYINSEGAKISTYDLRSFVFTTRNVDKSSESIHKLRANIRDVAEDFYEKKHKTNEADTHINKLINTLIDNFEFYFIPKDYKFQANDVFKKNEIQISRIRRANNYIYDNYNKQIKLEDLAEIENITPQYLTSILKRGGGIGFRKLLNMARVEKASHFLLESEKSLQSICYECGFSKYEYFNNAFKKFSDLTPAEFREKFKDLTIAKIAPQYEMLDTKCIIGLLKEMKSHYREIRISMDELNKDKLFDKDISASLDLKNYSHLSLFEYIKTATEEISLKNMLFDGLFIAEHKHGWENYTRIINDLFDIHLNVYITVDNEIKLKKYELLIRFINEYSEASGRALKLIIGDSKDKDEKTSKLIKIASDNHIEVALSNIQSYSFFSEKPFGKEDDVIEFALFEKSGLKLSSYHICSMLKKMGKYLIENTNDYYVTTNETRSEIQFLIYNFAEEYVKSIKDDFYGVDSDQENDNDDNKKSIVDYDINITDLDGLYAIREYRFREDDFDNRFDPGFDLSRLSSDCMNTFNQSLEPSKSVRFIKSNNSYNFSFSLIPFEILFLSIEKI